LQAFRAVIAFHKRNHPTRLAIRNVYAIAAHPPPLLKRRIEPTPRVGDLF